MFPLPICSVGFHSMTLLLDVFGKYFLQNALIHPVYLEKSLFEQIFTLSKRYKAGLVG